MNIDAIVLALANSDSVIVKASTHPKLNKKSRLTKTPCPYGEVVKTSEYSLALNDDYVKPETATETETERKPWYKPTEFKWLKASLDGKKFYISSHCLSVKSEFVADGRKLTDDEVSSLRAEFLPTSKPTDGMMWVMLSTDNILEIVK